MILSPQKLEKELINKKVFKYLDDNFDNITKDGGEIKIPNDWSIEEINVAEQILNEYNWQVIYDRTNAALCLSDKDVKILKLIPMRILSQEELLILEASKTAAISELIKKQSNTDIVPGDYPSFEIKEEEKNG